MYLIPARTDQLTLIYTKGYFRFLEILINIHISTVFAFEKDLGFY